MGYKVNTDGPGDGRMSPAAFWQWCDRLGLPAPARTMIGRVRSSPPSRRVQGGGGNVCGFYPSAKMGLTIQFESHRNELAAIYDFEHDPDVLEYWDQPEPIRLRYEAHGGRRVGVPHTPDFLVLRRDAVTWEECKPEDRLIALTEQSPHRYVRREDGSWRCPPGEEYAAGLGLGYRLRSSAAIRWMFLRNTIFLEDYLRENTPAVEPAVTGRVRAIIAADPGITLEGLAARAEGVARDALHTLIALGTIHTDLDAAPLAEPDRVRLFRDRATATAHGVVEGRSRPGADAPAPTLLALPGTHVLWDERAHVIVNAGPTKITLQTTDGLLVKLTRTGFEDLLKAGELTAAAGSPAASTASAPALRDILAATGVAEFAEANRRYLIVEPLLAAGSLPDDLPLPSGAPVVRTVRRWITAWRLAEENLSCGYAGLLPGWQRRGNRLRKLPEATLALMDRHIREGHETLVGKGALQVYGTLVADCERTGVVAPSSVTFHRSIRARPRHEQTLKREGRRAAYRHEPFYWELELTTPRHGERPFEICHIDHTELDIELICSRTGVNLGRPWLTLLVDAFSRRVLAAFVTFDAPSYRSCLIILRLCVQRYGRMPQIIVVDRGPEFRSTWFDTTLARHRVTKKLRPKAKARFGAVIERLFGTSNSQFVHNLAGNTKVMRNVRQVTKSVNPKELACWSLGMFYASLCDYTYDFYDAKDHPALGDSPRATFARGMALGGERAHLFVPYDETFRMLMLPTTLRGRSKVQPGSGVKINYNYYWTEEFRNPVVENTRVPVRYDPFDGSLGWAYVGKRWLRCTSWHWQAFRGRSEKEIMLATAQLRKLRQRHSGRMVISARALADFLSSVEAREALLPQRAKDAALREVFAVIDGGTPALPASVSPPPPQPGEPEGLPGDPDAGTRSPWEAATDAAGLQDFEDF